MQGRCVTLCRLLGLPEALRSVRRRGYTCPTAVTGALGSLPGSKQQRHSGQLRSGEDGGIGVKTRRASQHPEAPPLMGSGFQFWFIPESNYLESVELFFFWPNLLMEFSFLPFSLFLPFFLTKI